MSDIPNLVSTVIRGGYCVGCGACAAVVNSPVKIIRDEMGRLVAEAPGSARPTEWESPASRVCPFSDEAMDESQLAAELFPDSPGKDTQIGRYIQNYAGHVTDIGFRERGSSGGVAKWILEELLATGTVDAVVQVKAVPPDGSTGMLYRYSVMHSIGEVREGSKSAYYPVEMSEVLQYIRQNPGRYAITGVPCFIKALRLMARTDAVFAQRIAYCIGIVCGHMKSTGYAELLAWQLGVKPPDLVGIDFRKKLPGRRANEKGLVVTSGASVNPSESTAVVKSLFGGAFNHGFFQYRACDFCDDVLAETADVSVGDAWLPEYMRDGGGTSIVVVRHPIIHALVEDARRNGRLKLDVLTAERVAESQAGGLRQRREGLAYRLHLADRRNIWHPKKRTAASDRHLSRWRKKVYENRALISDTSHAAFRNAKKEGDLRAFIAEMTPLVERFAQLEKGPWLKRSIRFGRSIVRKMLRRE